MLYETLPFEVSAAVLDAARHIKLALFDVDGVLTDGSLYLGDDGQEYKGFFSRDGVGLKLLQRSGVELGIITGRTSRVVEHRAADLGIKHVFQGCDDKFATYDELTKKLGLRPEAVAYLGDDIVDLPILLKVGLSVTVQDANYLVKKHVHWITPSPGGRGAARDLCEMIMFAQGTHEAQMDRYLAAAKRC